MRPLSLRRRATIAFTLMGLVLSLMFAFTIDWIADDYESTIVEEVLQSQAEDYDARLAKDPAAALPRTRRLSGYLRRGNEPGDVPSAYRDLSPGFYEAADEDASGAHIGVFDGSAGRLYFVIDLSAIETFERHLHWTIAAVLVLGTAISGWLGWLLAGGALRPVRDLAKAVDSLPTQPRASALAKSISEDDLGRLASAIDRYQGRLVAADENERAFYADASHELRTPITVVRGVAEVLIDEPSADIGMRRRLRRMDRGMRELTDLLDLLFGMARRRTPEFEVLDAQALVQAATESLAGGQEDAGIGLDLHASGNLRLPRHESMLLLRVAIRHIVPPETAGKLQIRMNANAIDMIFLPSNGVSSAGDGGGTARSDRGRVPRLAERLAEQMGWRFESVADVAGHIDALRLQLPEDAVAPG